MDPSSFPDIPVDIARHILEVASFWDQSTARQLVLVSKHVRQWIDPLLYRSVEIACAKDCRLFIRTIESRSHTDPGFMAKNVKVLCLSEDGNSFSRITYILSHCTAVQNLAIFSTPDNVPFEHIYALENLQYLALSLPKAVAYFPFMPHKVSHLEITYPSEENIPIVQSILRASSKLTHLLITVDYWNEFPYFGDMETDLETCDLVVMLRKLLSAAQPSLQALIIAVEGDWFTEAELEQALSEDLIAEMRKNFSMFLAAVDDSHNRSVLLWYSTCVLDIPGVGWYGNEEPKSWLATNCEMWDEVDRVLCQRRLLQTAKTTERYLCG